MEKLLQMLQQQEMDKTNNMLDKEAAYLQYLNQPTTMDREGFLNDYQNHYGESFKDYLFRNNDKLSLEDIESIEDGEMDALLEILYGTSM